MNDEQIEALSRKIAEHHLAAHERDELSLVPDIRIRIQRLLDRYSAPVPEVLKTAACWVWNGRKNEHGYSVLSLNIDGKTVWFRVHRLAWIYKNERPIPLGLVPDHNCDVRGCINPGHIVPRTNHQNILRGSGPVANNARKTNCPQGHPLSGTNLYVYKGHRYCKTCRVQTNREYRRALAVEKVIDTK